MKSRVKEAREARRRRHERVRRKVRGTKERPRLCVYRSLGHMYAQIIDDDAGRTIVWASSLRLEVPAGGAASDKKKEAGRKTVRSATVGRMIAEKALEQGIKRVVFDRGGFLYHGRIAALAEAARKGGLEF
ncbi:MAG: 50S ribosomal protein L18 [Candidatus Krumholzibacteria bacterium]|nr:50S ribosomal protein L18 [Candidatus Krumholzibacteria bacterium]